MFGLFFEWPLKTGFTVKKNADFGLIKASYQWQDAY